MILRKEFDIIIWYKYINIQRQTIYRYHLLVYVQIQKNEIFKSETTLNSKIRLYVHCTCICKTVSRSFLILHKSIFDINLLFVVKIKEYCRVNSLHIIDLLATATPKLVKTDGGETRKDGGWECYDGGVGRYLVRYLVSHLVISGSGR